MQLIFKKIFFFVLYSATAVTACFFALILVLNFINPAVSQNVQTDQEKNKPGLKEIVGDIFKNLKTVLKDSMVKNESLGSDAKLEDPDSESPEPQEPPPEPQEPPELQELPPEPQEPSPESPEPQEESPSESQEATPELQELPPEPQESLPEPQESLPEQQEPSPEPQESQESPPEQQEPSPQEPAPELQEQQEPQAVSSAHSETDHSLEALSGVVPSDWVLDIRSTTAPFIYEYGTKKDPFYDPTVQEKSSKDGVILLPKTPPEEYDLKEIKLKGITWHTETPKALFELPNNAGYYTLIKGDKIGKNGVIFEIREDEVVIVETTVIGRGLDVKEEIKVKLKKLDRLNLSGFR